MILTATTVEAAAERIGVEPAVFLAVTRVETPPPHRGDFLSNGRPFPLILNERHWFYKLSGSYPVSRDFPDLSNARPGGYCQGRTWQDRQICEHKKLEKKLTIYGGALRDAALQSISMGLFQVMGFNHQILGYRSVEDMWRDAQQVDDRIDLGWFLRFCETKGLIRHLQRKDFTRFARGYNGPSYHKNRYDEKMLEYYEYYRRELSRKPLASWAPLDHERLPVKPAVLLPTGFPDFSQEVIRYA